ncbi:MAG: MFS transporter [Chloroflexota bacterium]|nr:MFS transporter [Chloroflexota bacterium]
METDPNSPSPGPAVEPAAKPGLIMLLILGLGGFTSALNVTMLSPLLVDIADAFDITEAAAGQLATVTAAAAGVMGLTVAPWMDQFSRRFWIRFECVLLLAGSLVSAFAPTFGLMFPARVLAGLGSAVIGATCLAACNDLYPDKAERNRAIGLISSAFTLGAVVGLPMITLIASALGWRTSLALPALFSAIVLLGSSRLPSRAPERIGSLWTAWKSGYGRVMRNPPTLWILGAVTGFMMVWFGWLIFFGAFAEETHLVAAGLLSALYLIGGGGELIGNNIAPWAMRRIAPTTVANIALVIAMVNLLLTGILWTGKWSLFPYIAIGSCALAVLFITLNVALLDSMPEDPGAVMSLQSAGLEVGGAVGVGLAGLCLTLFDDDYEVTFRVIALILPLIAFAIWRGSRHTAHGAPRPAA